MKRVAALLLVLMAGLGTPGRGGGAGVGDAPDPEEIRAERERLAAAGLSRLLERQRRLLGVTSRIRRAGAPLCGEKLAPVFGVVTADAASFPPAYREAARARLRVDGRTRLIHVLPGSPAAQAGLRAGDVVLSVDGRPLPGGARLESLPSSRFGDTIALEIEREDRVIEVSVAHRPGCYHAGRVEVNDAVNAYADGRAIVVLTGMMRFVSSDDELAIIVGHELAHNVLGDSATDGSAFEAEADYLACYFAARAGYDVSDAGSFDRRHAIEHPATLQANARSSHPSSPERALAMDATVREILGKAERGEPLLPGRPPSLEEEAETAWLGDEAFDLLFERGVRVLRISDRLRASAGALCGPRPASELGVLAARPRDFPLSYRRFAERRLGLRDGVTVLWVLPGSPADRGGIRAGDVILDVNGVNVQQSIDVFDGARRGRGHALGVSLQRNGGKSKLSLDAEPTCRHTAFVAYGDVIATAPHSNAEDFYVSTGLLRFVESDDELAIAIGHQIGHHVQGSALRGTPEIEARADGVGIRLAAAAGYDVSAAPRFWDRVADEHPWSIAAEAGGRPEHLHGWMPRRASAIRLATAEALAR